MRDGTTTRVDVAAGHDERTFLLPYDRPAVRALRLRPRASSLRHAYARLAGLAARAQSLRSLSSLTTARVSVLPWQLEAALLFTSGALRVLVADEVGLGKTIQAGVVIAEVRRREWAVRILLVVPAGLCRQWTGELRDRFRIDVTRLDRLTPSAAPVPPGQRERPEPGVWIASPDFLKQPHVRESLAADPWDLLVVDEAHDVCGESERHAACSDLALRSRRVLLLTATPHGGDEQRYRRLRELGSHGDRPVILRRTRTGLGLPGRRRLHWHRVRHSPAEQEALAVLAGFERAVLAEAHGGREGELLLLSVFRKRAFSTMCALARTAERRLAWIRDTSGADGPTWTQLALSWDAEDEPGLEALVSTVRLGPTAQAQWLERLVTAASEAARDDSKLRHLARVLARSREPAIVFTEFRDSTIELENRLRGIRRLAVAHGGQTPGEREQELTRFLEGEADTLVATDVASQGLNLQTRTRWVLNLELPWTPARLTQRAGRVDRLGQPHRVHVACLVSRHEAESGLLARLARRALAARDALDRDAESGPHHERDVAAALLLGKAPTEATHPPRPTTHATPRADATSETHAAAEPSPAPARSGDCRRRARAEATLVLRRRAWLRRWPVLDFAAYRPAAAKRRTQFATGPGMVLVFSVPVQDGTGHVLERHVAAVHVPRTADTWPGRDVVEAASHAAARHLEPRVRRVGRLVASQRDDALNRESAILHHIAALLSRPNGQDGLFDARARRLREHAQEDLQRLTADALALRARWGDRTRLTIGAPVLELVFVTC